MTVTIKRIGGSVGVVIPKSVAAELGLTEGTSLDISTQGSMIVMQRPGRLPRRPIAEIVAQMDTAAYRRRNKEFKDDGPVGKEIW